MRLLVLLFIAIPFLNFAQNDAALKHYGEAVKLFYQDDYSASIPLFDKAIAADGSFQFAYYTRGLAHEELKNYDSAIKDFSKVLSIDSAYVDGYVHRYNCYLKTADYSLAIEDLTKLIAFNPEVSDPYKNLGLCYYYTRQYALADEAYSFYLESNPKDESTWFQKGLSNFYYADYEQGIKDFTEVYSLNENYTTALEWRGRCYQKANYVAKACADWGLAEEKGLESAKTYSKKYCLTDY